jgi:hypothetical protein
VGAGLEHSEHFEQGFGHSLAFAAGSSRWAAAGTGVLHLWDGSVLKSSIAIPGYQHGNVSFDGQGASLRVGRWVVDTGTGAAEPTGGDPGLLVSHVEGPAASHPERFSEAAAYWSPDGERIVIVTQYRPPRGLQRDDVEVRPPRQVLLVDGRRAHVVAVLEARLGPLEQPAVAVGPTRLALAGRDVRVLTIDSGERDGGGRDGGGAPWVAACFSGDGGRLAAVGDGGAVAVWSEPEGSQIAGWAAPGPSARAVAYHAGEALVATATRSGTVTLWTGDGRELASASVGRDVQGLAFDPSGRLFVSTSPPNQSIDVFELGG